jgi:hypothetical protein
MEMEKDSVKKKESLHTVRKPAVSATVLSRLLGVLDFGIAFASPERNSQYTMGAEMRRVLEK